MSASAPLGNPSKNTGRVEAVCTRATSTGEVVSEVIIHAAATSFIQTQMLATSVTLHSKRKVGVRNGAQVEVTLAGCVAGVAPGSSSRRPEGEGGMGACGSDITANCQGSAIFLQAIAGRRRHHRGCLCRGYGALGTGGMLDLTSPSEKLVCMSFTLGKFSSTLRVNCEKLSRSLATTCSSNMPLPLM